MTAITGDLTPLVTVLPLELQMGVAQFVGLSGLRHLALTSKVFLFLPV